MSEVNLAGPRSALRINSARISGSLRRAAYRLQTGIDSHPFRAFALLSVLYLAVVAVLSSFKLLWLDELITLHIARLGSAAAIWQALQHGVDPNPPVSHLLVHYSRLLFGDHEFAYRLPALAGYWVGLLSLFAFLLRRLPPTWALGGTVLSMAMGAFDYSYESRSYAIFYGLAMLAMLCWSVAVDRTHPRWRHIAVVGMVIALAVGISTNYFAVLAFFPIAAGEIVRTIQAISRNRRQWDRSGHDSFVPAFDFRIWIGLVLAAATLLAYRSMISHAIAQFAPHAWNKVSLDQVADSYTEMVEVVLYPILALFFTALILVFVARQIRPVCQHCRSAVSGRWIGSILFPDSSRLSVPLHEKTAILTFMMYPILGYVIASIRGGMLSPRFVIPVCFGFAIAATLVAYRLFAGLRHAGMVLLGFCLAWFIARESVVGYWYRQQKQAFYKVVDHLPEAEHGLQPNAPIAIPDPLLALAFQHYAPVALASREVFPVDFPAIRNFRHDDSPEENLWAGRNFLYTLPVVPLAEFQHSAGRYLIVAEDGNWLIEDLHIHRYPVRRLAIESRAEDIGGFTPLAKETLAFYVAEGDRVTPESIVSNLAPEPFHTADNLPDSKSLVPGETAQE